MTLRRRLTLWYGGLLAAVLAVALTLVYFVHAEADQEGIAAALGEMSAMAVASLRDQLATGTRVDELTLATPHWGVSEAHAMWLFVGPDLLASSGDAAAAPFTQIGAATLASGWHHVFMPDGRMLASVTDVDGRVRLVASVSLARVDAANEQLRLALFVLGVIAVAVGAGVGSTLAAGALRPVAAMTHAAADIARSRDFSRRVSIRGDGEDELVRLGATFDEMLASLDGAFRQQQQFVADVSHELRTPLTTIRGNAELLAAGETSPDDQAGAVSQIRREAERLSRLVSELLVLARADAAEAFAPRAVQLDDVLVEAVSEMRTVGGTRLRVGALEAAAVEGERDRLKQLIIALLDNGIRYTPDGGCVVVSLADDGKDAVLRVEDEGIGIAVADLPRIFDRFYRGDAARRLDASGSGLGLAIAKWIVTRHAGTIRIEPRERQGTRVTVHLPLATMPVSAR